MSAAAAAQAPRIVAVAVTSPVATYGPVAGVTASANTASDATAATAGTAGTNTATSATAGTNAATSSSAAPNTAAASSAAPNTAAGPHILSVAASPKVVHAGDNVAWDVRTTKDVVSVAAHVSVYTLPLQRTAPGHFKLNFAIPASVPSIFHGTYNLDVIGKTSDGETTSTNVSLTFE